MAVETTFAMMTTVWGSKTMRHLTWRGFEAHPAYLMMAFNILVKWDGLEPGEAGRTHRSIAQFVSDANQRQCLSTPGARSIL